MESPKLSHLFDSSRSSVGDDALNPIDPFLSLEASNALEASDAFEESTILSTSFDSFWNSDSCF